MSFIKGTNELICETELLTEKTSPRSAGLGEIGADVRTPLSVRRASRVGQLVKNPPARQETLVRSLGREDPLAKGEATHSSVLAWRMSWTV